MKENKHSSAPTTAPSEASPLLSHTFRGFSVRRKILFAFLLFTILALCLLWLFQFVFLDQIYRSIKIGYLENGADAILRKIGKDDLFSSAEEISERYDFTAMLVYPKTGSQQKLTENRPGCMLFDLNTIECSRLIIHAEEEGGSAMVSIRRDPQNGYTAVPFPSSDQEQDPQNVLYTILFETEDGTTAALLINTVLTPISAARETLFFVLLAVSVILLILALTLAIFMSRSIARPIVKISHGARRLAEGDYTYRFDETGGYREVGELAATLNYTSDQLSRLENLRRELIANISHDLRTPLTLISGYSEVMRDIPGEITAENLQTIIDESARLTSLVNDMLEISKIQSGNLNPTLAPFSFTEMLRESVATYETLATCQGYHFHIEASEEITVIGDRAMLVRALNNLINNALTHTGADRTVRITQIVTPTRVRVEVNDSGEGIPREKLHDIWDRYYKVDNEHKRSAVGTGLGLSIVKSIVSLHGGSYGVRSSNGFGSTFWFELNR